MQVELRDISLAGGSSPRFPRRSLPSSASTTTSPSSGELVTRPEANVIKLPNVSASIPQLKATIEELRAKGLMVPDYPDEPSTPTRSATSRPGTTR